MAKNRAPPGFEDVTAVKGPYGNTSSVHDPHEHQHHAEEPTSETSYSNYTTKYTPTYHPTFYPKTHSSSTGTPTHSGAHWNPVSVANFTNFSKKEMNTMTRNAQEESYLQSESWNSEMHTPVSMSSFGNVQRGEHHRGDQSGGNKGKQRGNRGNDPPARVNVVVGDDDDDHDDDEGNESESSLETFHLIPRRQVGRQVNLIRKTLVQADTPDKLDPVTRKRRGHKSLKLVATGEAVQFFGWTVPRNILILLNY